MNFHNRVLLSGIVLAAAAFSAPTYAQNPSGTPGLVPTQILKGRDLLWDMAFLPDGTMFFTEKCAGLSVRMPNGTINPLLGIKDSKGYPDTASDLFCSGQAGMSGVAIDPEFAQNRLIYVYSASSMTAPGTNRVMRLTVNGDMTRVSGRTDLITDITYKSKPTNHPFGDAGAHNGGRLRFGPTDGFLYVTTGDTHNSQVPQSPTMLGGKVLRITRDGQAAPGNNAPAGFDARIYAYGFRNPQGICFRPGSNQPYTAENGPWHSDEVTAISAGGNGGWDPRANMAGRGDCPDSYCGYSPNQMGAVDPKDRSQFMPMTDLKTYPNAMKPAWNNELLSQGMSSCTFLNGPQWKDWNGRMVVTFMGIGIHGTPVGNRLDVLNITSDGLSATRVTASLPVAAGRFRSAVQGPDGSLYIATDQGDLHQLKPN